MPLRSSTSSARRQRNSGILVECLLADQGKAFSGEVNFEYMEPVPSVLSRQNGDWALLFKKCSIHGDDGVPSLLDGLVVYRGGLTRHCFFSPILALLAGTGLLPSVVRCR